MVIRLSKSSWRRAYLMVELLIAIAILTGALLPIAYSIVAEKKLARSAYQRAIAMEIVDGEMEALVAGQWRAFKAGTQEYQVRARALRNLPPGKFLLTIRSNQVRLEWLPGVKDRGGPVSREAVVK